MAKKNSGGSPDMKKFYGLIALVVVIAVGAVGMSMRSGDAATQPVDLGEIDDEALINLAQGVIYGDPDAPITIMEFGDYQCPACGAFALQIKPQVDLAYIESGQAKLVFHDFPIEAIHPNAFLAARAARCGGEQDRYFDFHDALFSSQRDWSTQGNPAGSFIDLADEIGLDTSAFRSCLRSDRYADVVTANMTLGQRLGVSGTPTLFVHDGTPPARRLGGFQFIDVQQAIEGSEPNG